MGKGTRAIGGAAQGAAAGAALGPWGAVAGGALGALGGLFGGGESEEEKAAKAIQQAYGDQTILTPEQRRVQLEYLKSVGQLTPEMEQAIAQQDTQLKSINVDPRFKSAQMAALNRLNQQGHEGLTLEDRSALADVQRQNAQAQRGQQEAILQNAQARGMGGAGAELAARLSSAQSGADQAGSQGLKVAAQAQQNALQAMLAGGNLAGQMGQQEFSNQAQVGSAQDLINRFNTGNQQNVQHSNVGARNAAQESNLRDAQNREANRVDTMNRQRQGDANNLIDYTNSHNNQLIGKAGAGMGVAQAHTAAEQRADSGYASLLGGVGGAVSAAKSMIPSSLTSGTAPSAYAKQANAGTSPLAKAPNLIPEEDDLLGTNKWFK
jgi:hypothetical protein